MLFKVKDEARFSEYVACGGLQFSKRYVTDVPDGKVEEAQRCEFLVQVQEESKNAPMPVGGTPMEPVPAEGLPAETEAEAPAEEVEEKSGKKSAKKKEG